MTFKIYSYAEIKATPIGELREFAKEIGVKAPTTLSKDALDSAVFGKILEIEESRKVPSDLTRPRAKAAILDKSAITPSDRENFGPFGKKYDKMELKDFAGFFRPYRYGDGIVSRTLMPDEHDFFLSQSFVESASLVSGDFVKGKYAVSADSGVNVVAVLESVNGRDISEKRAPDIRFKDKLMAFQDLDVWAEKTDMRAFSVACPLKKGSRILITHDKTVSLTDFASRLVKRLRSEKLLVFPLFLAAMPEMENVLMEIDGATACTFDVPTEFSDYAVQLLIDAARRQAEEGRDVAVVVDNVEVCAQPELVRGLMGCACQLREGSITVIVTANQDIMAPHAFNMLASFSDGAVRMERDRELYVDFAETWVKCEWSDYPILDKLKNMSGDLVRTMIRNCASREQLEKLLK